MSNKKVLRIEDELYGGYTTIHNPVSEYWDIELYLFNESHENYAFIVKFTSKLPIELPGGQTVTQHRFIKEVDFEDKEKSIRKELRNIGMINDIIFKGIKDYIEYLKLNNQYAFYHDIDELSNDEYYNSQQESLECYGLLQQEIRDNLNLFPTSRKRYRIGVSEGMIVSNYKGRGFAVVVLERDKLQDIINVFEKVDFEDILRGWRDQGLLLSGVYKENRLTSKFTFCTNYRSNAYIIKLDKSFVDEVIETA